MRTITLTFVPVALAASAAVAAAQSTSTSHAMLDSSKAHATVTPTQSAASVARNVHNNIAPSSVPSTSGTANQGNKGNKGNSSTHTGSGGSNSGFGSTNPGSIKGPDGKTVSLGQGTGNVRGPDGKSVGGNSTPTAPNGQTLGANSKIPTMPGSASGSAPGSKGNLTAPGGAGPRGGDDPTTSAAGGNVGVAPKSASSRGKNGKGTGDHLTGDAADGASARAPITASSYGKHGTGTGSGDNLTAGATDGKDKNGRVLQGQRGGAIDPIANSDIIDDAEKAGKKFLKDIHITGGTDGGGGGKPDAGAAPRTTPFSDKHPVPMFKPHQPKTDQGASNAAGTADRHTTATPAKAVGSAQANPAHKATVGDSAGSGAKGAANKSHAGTP